MNVVKSIKIPIIADSVLSPTVQYEDGTAEIYFTTSDDQFGRITFCGFDAIKVCRGEITPYQYQWGTDEKGTWVFRVEHSHWLNERYEYEKNNYGDCYGFGGDVNEMLTDYSHYLFSFHDQFVEVIAKGFWFEKDTESLFKKEWLNGHPALPLSEQIVKKFEVENKICTAKFNPKPISELVENTNYCPQTLMEFRTWLEPITFSATIFQRQGKLMSVLNQPFNSKPFFEKEGIATFEELLPIVEKDFKEVLKQRNKNHIK